jgi:hypothetical protein
LKPTAANPYAQTPINGAGRSKRFLAAQPVLTGFYSLPSRGVSARGGDDMPRTFYHFLLNPNLIITWFLRNGKKKPVNGNPADFQG